MNPLTVRAQEALIEIGETLEDAREHIVVILGKLDPDDRIAVERELQIYAGEVEHEMLRRENSDCQPR